MGTAADGDPPMVRSYVGLACGPREVHAFAGGVHQILLRLDMQPKGCIK